MDQEKISKLIKENKYDLRRLTKKYHNLKTGEGSVKTQIKGYMKLKGWFIFPILQGLGSYPGISDFIAVKFGRTLYIEAKGLEGSQRPNQKDFQADIEAHGGIYYLVECLEDVIEIDRIWG